MTLGAESEALAASHLAALGWRVLERNWRGRTGELDLVAEEGRTVVFVEVKARSSRRRGTPEEAVGPAKQARLSRVAAEYLARRGWLERPCRFDVAAVEGGKIRLHRGAFPAAGGTTP